MQGKRCGLWLVAATLAWSVGCQAVQISPSTNDLSHQHGATILPAGQELDVYYPAPFSSPPNLLTKSIFNDCLVVEQQPDHFRIKNPTPFSREVSWEARGLPVTAPAPVQVNVAIPEPTPDRNSSRGTGFASSNR